MTFPATCTCPRLRLALVETETRNWHPDCPDHGTASAWWAERQTQRTSALATLARRARAGEVITEAERQAAMRGES